MWICQPLGACLGKTHCRSSKKQADRHAHGGCWRGLFGSQRSGHRFGGYTERGAKTCFCQRWPPHIAWDSRANRKTLLRQQSNSRAASASPQYSFGRKKKITENFIVL